MAREARLVSATHSGGRAIPKSAPDTFGTLGLVKQLHPGLHPRCAPRLMLGAVASDAEAQPPQPLIRGLPAAGGTVWGAHL